jgi:hypothetical protein
LLFPSSGTPEAFKNTTLKSEMKTTGPFKVWITADQAVRNFHQTNTKVKGKVVPGHAMKAYNWE